MLPSCVKKGNGRSLRPFMKTAAGDDIEDQGLKFLQHVRKRCKAAVFIDISQKKKTLGSNPPPPYLARINIG